MGKEEVEEVLQRYNITKGQLLKIFKTDPVVKKLKAEVGDVIKITKKGSSSDNVVYRVVVSE